MSNERGFLLVEALVAFTLLALVVAAAYQAMGGAARAGATGVLMFEALARAENALAAARGDDALAIGSRTAQDGYWRETVTVTEAARSTLVEISATARHADGASVTISTLAQRRAP